MFHAKHKFQSVCLISALCFAVLSVGCGATNSGMDTYRIGANLELTGVMAASGQSAANGVRMAVKEANSNGGIRGKQVDLFVADNKSNVADAADSMLKLIAQDKVLAVIAPVGFSAAIAAAPITEHYKIPAISPASNPQVTVDPLKKKVREFVFRSASIDPLQGTAMANFAVGSLKAKTAAIYIDSNSEYSNSLARKFEETFVKKGGRILNKEAYVSKETDYKSTLAKIKSNGPDVLFLPGFYQDVGIIIRQAREIGLNVSILGGDGWESVKLSEIATVKALNRCFYSIQYSPDEPNSKVTTFNQAYQKEFNSVPDSIAALSYDATRMVLDAIRRADSSDPIKIKDELQKTRNFEAVTGTLSVNESNDPEKGAVIVELKDGKPLFRGRISP